MKLKIILLAFLALTLVAIGTIAWVGHASPAASLPQNRERAFEVRGWVRAIEADRRALTIEHDDIPDFMPSMTMPFPVHDPALLGKVSVGDRVSFQLMVGRREAWISGIRKIPAEGPAPAPLSAAEGPRLQAGERVPNFALVDQDGRPLRLRDFRGKAVVLTFVFTRCPMPNFCPLMSSNFKSLQGTLDKKFHGKFHLLTISFDPEFDTPQVLKNYAANFGANTRSWSFATGTPQQVEEVTSLFGLFHKPEGGSITHDLRTALIDPEGRLVHVWKSNLWQPREVEDMLSEVVSRS